MSYKWQGTSESGILRRNDNKEKLDELLVFGYACKLFRDDEKALFIDQGKHLIPWMGDDKLKIDRYDGRGTLSELTSCEASREGYDAMRWLGLSEPERRLEQLCDEERFYSLHINEEEEELYKEEELKRIAQKGKEVGYNYEAPSVTPENSENSQGPSLPSEGEEEEEPFVPPPELDVPVNVLLPKTAKQNARIEKTALFISKQGPQMEILLKAKQKDNAQFSFMTSDDPLYRYYRHVLMAIKTGHYRPISEQQPMEEAQPDGDAGAQKSETDDHYLHPSLIKTAPVLVESAPPLPALPFKPSANCAYSQLVNRIQNNQPQQKRAAASQDGGSGATVASDQQSTYSSVQSAQTASSAAQTGAQNYQQLTVEQQQYYQQQYYAQYYEYYRQNGYYPQTSYTQAQIEQLYAMQQQTAASQKSVPDPSNPYAQIVSNVAPIQASAAAIPAQQQPTLITGAPVLYSTSTKNGQTPAPPAQPAVSAPAVPKTTATEAPTDSPPATVASMPAATPAVEKTLQKAPLLSLAQYGSETDSEEDSNDDENSNEADDQKNQSLGFVTPPQETQLIIDKMASYVAKNGTDFEAIVKSKGDPRFVFLNTEHEHNGYYRYKISVYTNFEKKNNEEANNSDSNKDATQQTEETKKCIKEKKVIAPVCFSIKKAKDCEPTIEKSALPVEESDEEEDGTNDTAAKDSKSSTASTTPETNARASALGNASAANASVGSAINSSSNEQQQENMDKVNSNAASKAKSAECEAEVKAFLLEDPLQELIDLTDDLEERRDAKRAEDRLKDKIAAAAREKMSSSTRDKALQLERKKRAAAFLSQLKSNPQESKEREPKRSKTDSGGRGGGGEMERDSRNSESEEEGEIKSGSSSKHQKSSSRKKKSHKRKRSKSKHEKRDHRRDKDHKKSKRRRRRSRSSSSGDSDR